MPNGITTILSFWNPSRQQLRPVVIVADIQEVGFSARAQGSPDLALSLNGPKRAFHDGADPVSQLAEMRNSNLVEMVGKDDRAGH